MNEVVYFIRRGDGPIKIGHTRNLSERISALSVGHPVPFDVLATIPGTRSAEKHFHEKLSTSRLNGEWFTASAEVLETIDQIRRVGAPLLAKDLRPVNKHLPTDAVKMNSAINNLCREYVLGIARPVTSELTRAEMIEVVAKCARLPSRTIKQIVYRETKTISAHTLLSLRAAFIARHIGKSSLFETDIAVMLEAARILGASDSARTVGVK